MKDYLPGLHFFAKHCSKMNIFTQSYPVRAAEIDRDFLMRRTAAAAYFQECFAQYAASKTLAAYDVFKLGLTWLTSDMIVEFAPQMPFWREKIDVSAWVRPANSSIKIFVDFVGKCNGEKVFCGTSVQLIADLAAHRPAKSDALVSRFERREECAVESPVFEKIPDIDQPQNSISKIVRSFDLDFNNHLNNVHYLPISFEALPAEFRAKRKLKRYQIKFLREVFLGDTVEARAQIDGDTTLHSLSRSSDGGQMCKIIARWY